MPHFNGTSEKTGYNDDVLSTGSYNKNKRTKLVKNDSITKVVKQTSVSSH